MENKFEVQHANDRIAQVYIHYEESHLSWDKPRLEKYLQEVQARLQEMLLQKQTDIQVLSLPSFWPISVNALMSANKFERSKLKSADAEQIGYEAVRQHIRKAEGRRQVKVLLYLGQKGKRKLGRRVDEDNPCKSVYDALSRNRIIKDDSMAWCRKLMPEILEEGFPDVGGMGTLIIIEDLPEIKIRQGTFTFNKSQTPESQSNEK